MNFDACHYGQDCRFARGMRLADDDLRMQIAQNHGGSLTHLTLRAMTGPRFGSPMLELEALESSIQRNRFALR